MRTIFRKQLLFHLGILAICLAILGFVLIQLIRTYFMDQRVASLQDSALRVSTNLEEMLKFQFGVFDIGQLNQEINAMHRFLNAQLIVISHDFRILVSTSTDIVNNQEPMYHDSLQPLMQGYPVVVYGTLDGLYRQPLLVVGQPIWVGDMVVGSVLVGTSLAEIRTAIEGMHRLTLLSIAASALVAGILIYASSKAISLPLMQMNEAARVIADGNFEKRITVCSKDEVGQLAESFNNMAKGLQEQERVRRDFIANLSHDIRSPLTSMKGFLQAIDDGTVPPEKLNYYIKIVMDESDRLIKLADNILNAGLIQESALCLTIFDINGLIRKTVLSFEAQATEKNHKLHCHFAKDCNMVKADYDKIQRVIYNLVDNSVKFVPRDGEIVVETSVEDDQVYVSVKDNGPGISLEDQSHVFDRFFKGDPSRNEYKRGNGLGLSIVKEITRAHGGQITVKSNPGEGCVFTFFVQSWKF